MFSVLPIEGNHLDAELNELGIQAITVIGFVTNEPLWEINAERRLRVLWTSLISAELALQL